MSILLLRLAAAAAVLLVLLALPRWAFSARYGRLISSPEASPARPIALVFGAGLRRDGTPTTVLADRVRTAASLYHQGKARMLLLSGSDLSRFGDETEAMKTLAIQLGVPPEAILVDPGGHRTYATCQRARQVFAVRQALLVTQDYHLPRALAICRAAGIDALGASADLHPYSRRALAYWRLREYPASIVAVWESFLRPWLSPAAATAETAQDCPDLSSHES